MLDARDRRKALHDLIDEAREEDLPLLRELLARFQRPLDFPMQRESTVLPETASSRRRQELILQAHLHAKATHLLRQHIASTAKRLGIDPVRILAAAGGASHGENDSVEMSRNWPEGSAVCHLNTIHVENREIITFDKAKISNSASELIYNVRVLTSRAESKTELNVPL